MKNFIDTFVNNSYLPKNKVNNAMVKISWGGVL